VAAHAALSDLLAATTALDEARGAAAGALLGALAAIALVAIARPPDEGENYREGSGRGGAVVPYPADPA
jgi:hypothetical protein